MIAATFFDFIDPVLRVMGWVVAVAIGFGSVATSAAIAITPFRGWFERGRLAGFIGLCLAAVVWAVVLFLFWRVLRFAGGYIGSSEYPLHHVVRFFF
jgi:hypothetical protein